MRELGFLYSQHWRIAPCLGKATQINAGARSVSSLTKLADAGAWLYSFAWLQGVRRETAHGKLVWRGAGRRGRLGVWRWRGNQVRQGKVKGAINQEGGKEGRKTKYSSCSSSLRNARCSDFSNPECQESYCHAEKHMFTHLAVGLAST